MARPNLNEAERAERRNQLLDAAHMLYREQSMLPTVAEIAAAAGIAKGSVYLSFATKEEIFIALLEDSFGQLLGKLHGILNALPFAPLAAAQFFSQHYVDALEELPDLLPLAAMTNAVLEKNLPLEATIRFKQGLASGLQSAGQILEQRNVGLKAGAGADLLMYTWGLTLGLWQALDYPDDIRRQLAEPSMKILDRKFEMELRSAVLALWQGGLPAEGRQAPN